VINAGARAQDILILDYYNADLRLLHKLFHEKRNLQLQMAALEDLYISTIDSSQGREREYVIVSMVRPGGKNGKGLGFVEEEDRKHELTIIGNKHMECVNYHKENGWYITRKGREERRANCWRNPGTSSCCTMCEIGAWQYLGS
jgi:superfamily I DNA and/or RNA helicase